MGSIQLSGDVSRFQERLKNLSEIDLKRVNSVLGQVVRTSTMERFRTGKDPNGVRWQESQRVREIGGKTLTSTAGLKNSLNVKTSTKGFALGSNLKYAATHQFGDKDRVIRARTAGGLHFRIGGNWLTVKSVKVTIPARPYLGINDEDIREISSTLEDILSEG